MVRIRLPENTVRFSNVILLFFRIVARTPEKFVKYRHKSKIDDQFMYII